jgi:hypothetical protein
MKAMNIRGIRFIFVGLLSFLLLGSKNIVSAGPFDGEASGHERAAQEIRLVEHVQNVAFVDAPPAGPSLGDRLVFSSDLFDQDGRKVGSDAADCVTVRIDSSAPAAQQQIFQCAITVQLADGQITFQGMAKGTENFFAITGGTGAYRTARGEAFAKDLVPLQVADVTIMLFR